MSSDFSRNAYRQGTKEDGTKKRRKRKRENEPVGMISLETLRDTIESVRDGARQKHRKRAKDIKSVSQRWEEKEKSGHPSMETSSFSTF